MRDQGRDCFLHIGKSAFIDIAVKGQEGVSKLLAKLVGVRRSRARSWDGSSERLVRWIRGFCSGISRRAIDTHDGTEGILDTMPCISFCYQQS